MNARLALPVILFFSMPLFAGTVLVRSGNYIGDTTTETFTISKQIFTGSTNCTSGGGAVTTVSGIDQTTGHSFPLAAGDSALLYVAPGAAYATSEQNGPWVSWYTDPAFWPDTVFGPGRWKRSTAPNDQKLDREGLVARVMSASYAPKAGTSEHETIVDALEKLHDRYAYEGTVRITYLTVIVSGRIGAT